MVNRNQTWSEGGVESGQLLSESIVPISQAQLDREAAAQRLRAAQGKPIATADLPSIVEDILEILTITA